MQAIVDDRDAIERCQAGDNDAFHHLVERYQKEAMGHALAILRNRDDAADAVQTAFVRAFKALDHFEPGRRFYPWFYTILQNCSYKLAARRPAPAIQLSGDLELLASAGDESSERRTRLFELALQGLSAEDRELITLKHLDGCRYTDLAERLNIAAGTVMSRLYHARKPLRGEVQKLMEQDQ